TGTIILIPRGSANRESVVGPALRAGRFSIVDVGASVRNWGDLTRRFNRAFFERGRGLTRPDGGSTRSLL
ncbi:MAG: hypothetical protein IJM54_02135, partial [Thermoguttaceae bacterium]|nr:hypothetical protein [Thermoguttaceae bacterium]